MFYLFYWNPGREASSTHFRRTGPPSELLEAAPWHQLCAGWYCSLMCILRAVLLINYSCLFLFVNFTCCCCLQLWNNKKGLDCVQVIPVTDQNWPPAWPRSSKHAHIAVGCSCFIGYSNPCSQELFILTILKQPVWNSIVHFTKSPFKHQLPLWVLHHAWILFFHHPETVQRYWYSSRFTCGSTKSQ